MIWKVLWYWLHLCQQRGLRHSHGRMHRVNDYQKMSSHHSAHVPDFQWYYDPLSHRKNILLLSQFTGTSQLLWASCLGSGCFIALSVHSGLFAFFAWVDKALTIFSPSCSSSGFHTVFFTVVWNVRMSFYVSYWFITGVLLASGLAALASASHD